MDGGGRSFIPVKIPSPMATVAGTRPRNPLIAII